MNFIFPYIELDFNEMTIRILYKLLIYTTTHEQNLVQSLTWPSFDSIYQNIVELRKNI